MNRILSYTAIGLVIGAAFADKPETASVDSVDHLIEKSMQTIHEAAVVSQRADQVVIAQVQEMKEAIEVLEEEKAVLVEQNVQYKMVVEEIQEAYNEVVYRDSAVLGKPFDLFAILPDTTGGGK